MDGIKRLCNMGKEWGGGRDVPIFRIFQGNLQNTYTWKLLYVIMEGRGEGCTN